MEVSSVEGRLALPVLLHSLHPVAQQPGPSTVSVAATHRLEVATGSEASRERESVGSEHRETQS